MHYTANYSFKVDYIAEEKEKNFVDKYIAKEQVRGARMVMNQHLMDKAQKSNITETISFFQKYRMF